MLEKLLNRTTNKLWKSLSFGVVTTSLMQSSSLISIITISFLSAGLITLTAGIGIIFGANLGTTTGAWLVAAFGLKVNISVYAMPMLVFGVILLLQKNKTLKGIGYVLAGLGFLFLGIHYMKEGFEAFKDRIDLTAYAVTGYKGVLLFTLIGMLATVVMQSSHATLVLIITALAAQQITYENALALAIGANLGTTITAIIGSLGANVNGRRLAAAHLIFNAVTAAVAITFIYQLSKTVDIISVWLSIAGDNYTLKLAIFHSIFNAIGILLMLPLIPTLERFLKKVLHKRVRTVAQPRYLHKATTELSDTVIEAVRNETLHLYDNAFNIIAGGLRLRPDDVRCQEPLQTIIQARHRQPAIEVDSQYNITIKDLYSSIIEYISQALPEMTPEQADKLFSFRAAGREIVEAIKDTKHLQKNLANYANSPSKYLRQEYDQLRLALATFLRELEHVRQQKPDESMILALDNLRLKMKKSDKELNIRLEAAIREKKITPQQATSI
ncbi:MAG: sodium:phosphate symporter, partial [Neptuniibacter caesariensis]